MSDPITIRHSTSGDRAAVEELAELDGRPAPVGDTLLAEVDGRLTVAVVPVSGTLDLKALAAAAGGKKAFSSRVPSMSQGSRTVIRPKASATPAAS